MYAILDIESTGGKYNEEGIIEIAIYRFDGREVVDELAVLINPEREIQPFVAKLTGIDSALLHSAPKFHELAERILEITRGAVLVAHNAQFDYRILRTEFRRLGYNYQRKTLCTVALSQKMLPEAPSYSLGKLVHSLGIPLSNHHRAQDDALATLQLFKLLLTKAKDKAGIQQSIREAMYGELSPSLFAIVSALPSETGIYSLCNREKETLLLGTARNLKKKVTQHFTRKAPLTRRLQKETRNVMYEKTGSDLIALLRIYEKLKNDPPRYNPPPKKRLFSHVITFDPRGNGSVVLNSAKNTPFQQGHCMGFKSIATAQNFLRKISVEFNLSAASPGLEQTGLSTKNSLYARGVLLGGTAAVMQAFAKYSLRGKNMVLLDDGRKTGEQSFVLVKNGRLQGFGYGTFTAPTSDSSLWEAMMTPLAGDENTTFLIESYLRKNKKIKTLPLTSHF